MSVEEPVGARVCSSSLSLVDNKAVLAALMEAVEREDTPQSYAYAFLAAAAIPEVDLSALFENIEDIVAQADETSSTLYVRPGGGRQDGRVTVGMSHNYMSVVCSELHLLVGSIFLCAV